MDFQSNVIKLAKHNLFEIHKFCISFFITFVLYIEIRVDS